VRGEDLCHRSARVVGHEIDGLQLEGVAERSKHFRLQRQSQVPTRGKPRLAMRRQLDRQAAPFATDFGDDFAPEEAVEKHPVNKQRGGSRSNIDVGDLAVLGLDGLAMATKLRDLHFAAPATRRGYAGVSSKTGALRSASSGTPAWSASVARSK
jgi:hypothetical protein